MSNDLFTRDNFQVTSGQRFVTGGKEYTLGGSVGAGAIGIVRRAVELRSRIQVAVKFLAPEPKYIEESSFEDMRARFRREGMRGEGLSHNHLVKIIAYEENKDGSCFPEKDNSYPVNPFIVMEQIQGRTLEHHIEKRAKVTDSANNPHFNITPQSLFIAYSIINALHHIHKRKIVHRDVKPANIYLNKINEDTIPTTVKLGDFGIVKWGDFKASITTGSLTIAGQQGLGSLKYMPPEQALNPKEIEVRADMYSLGITLFELFTDHILPTPHHVFQIVLQRSKRSNVLSKLHELGYGFIPLQYERLFTNIYDMLASAYHSRPSSQEMEGRLQYLLDEVGYSHLYLEPG